MTARRRAVTLTDAVWFVRILEISISDSTGGRHRGFMIRLMCGFSVVHKTTSIWGIRFFIIYMGRRCAKWIPFYRRWHAYPKCLEVGGG